MQDNKDERIAQLEDEVRILKAQLEGSKFTSGEDLKKRRDTLDTFDNMPNGTIYRSVRDVRTGILGFDYVSGTWENITGVTAEASLSDARNVFKNGHPEDLPLLMQRISESQEPLRNFDIEVRYNHPVAKKEIWVQITSYPVRIGDYIYADGFIFDITARKEMEQKLLTEKNRLESLGNNLPNMAIYQFIHDLKTQKRGFSYLSRSWETITGISIEDGLNDLNALFATIHPDDLPLLIREMSHTVGEKDNFFVEVRATVDSRSRWVQLAARRRLENDMFIADGIITDITERKEIEIVLKNEKNRLEALGNNLPNAVLYQYIRDIKAQKVCFTYLSDSWETITGIPAEVAMNDFNALFKVVHSDDLPLLIQEMGDTTKDRFFVEFRIIVRGNPRWLQFAAQRFFNGESFVSDGIIMDITDRKETELALAESEQKHRFVFENTKEVFLIQDVATNKVTFISGSTVEVFGYSNEEIMQFLEHNTINGIIVPEHLPKVHSLCEEYVKKYFEIGKLPKFQYEAQMYRRDGSVFWAEVSMHLIADETGNLTQAVGIISNIDNRKKAELALVENESKQRFVFDNMKDLYWIMDMKTSKFTFMAGAGYEMYGYTNEEIMQQELSKLFDEPTKKKVNLLIEEKIQEYYKTGIIQNFQFEELQYRKDGSRIWVECTYQLVPDETGKITQLVGIDRDVDERKRMELELTKYRENLEKLVQERTDELTSTNEELVAVNEEMIATNEELTAINEELDSYKSNLEGMVEIKTVELVRAKEKAEEADKLKSAFLANMSHEIRTPLNGIVGLLRFIDNDISNEERHENIKLIQNCSSHLQKLINDIVDISKIEAHLLNINPVPLRLNDLMNEMQMFYENYLQSENRGHIMIVLDDSGFIDQCVIHADTMRLRQVLDNLIGNALKFTETGYIRFGYRQSAPDKLEFTVQDTGIGLAPNQLEVIFERFRQAEIGNNRQYGGTGLGLTISRSLAQMMGGKMWVESNEGEGASFYFTISYQPISTENVPII